MNPKLIKLIFSTASIKRWNEFPRPFDFVELDRQAHKMIIAYLLGHYERFGKKEFEEVIKLGIAGVLYRAVLTDLKSPVYNYLRKKKAKELDEFVLGKLEGVVDEELKYYVKLYNNTTSKPKQLLNAASHFANLWEFDFIYNFAKGSYGVEEVKRALEYEIEEFYGFEGVRALMLKKKSYDFISLCGNLRFQKRWSNTPRVPQTSVLGHMLFVAVVAFFLTREAKRDNIYYNFFGGLFHDIIEAFTRDIIAPIKHGVEGLDEILKEYEKRLIEEKFMPMVPEVIKEIKIFIEDEFANKEVGKSGVKIVREVKNGIDGELIKVADHFGAFVEAIMSIEYGVKSPELIEAVEVLSKQYKGKKVFGIDVGKYFSKEFFKK
jgi:putative hydrolase of HD superfamily